MADKVVVVRLALKSGQFTAGLAQAGTATQKFGTQVASGASKASSGALALGTASAAAGKLMLLGVGGALAVSAKAAIDFESSMASVAKTTDLAGNSFDSSSGPLFRFGEALRDLSLRTPINVNELAEVAALGGQLGVEVPNLIEFTEVMAAMGVATNMSATEAAKGFARFANIMGTNETEFDRLGSTVVELGNNMATTESEILTFATRLAPVGVVVGMTEEEVFGLAAALTSLGVPAERGGTALQRVFISMKQAVDEGGVALAEFAEIATSGDVQAFQDLFKESPAKAFAAFVKGLDDVSRAGGNVFAVLDRLHLDEQRTIQVLLATASGYRVVAEAIDLAADAGAENTALFEEARKRYGTTASQVQILGNAFNDLRIEIGNAVLGSGGLSFAIDALRNFLGIMKENLPLLGRLATAFAVIGALRLGANFIELGGRALDAVRGMGTAAIAMKTMGTAARVGSMGVLLLNAAMSGVLAIGTIVAGIWAFQAIKAAELRAEVELLNEAIANGKAPGEALEDRLRATGTLTADLEGKMHAVGLTSEDLVSDLLAERSAFDDLSASGQSLTQTIQALADDKGITFDEALAGVNAYLGALKSGRGLVDQFYQTTRNRLVSLALEGNIGTKLTIEQLRNMASAAMDMFGTDVTDSEFVKWMTGEMRMDGWQGRFSSAAAEAQSDIIKVDDTWVDYIRNLEGGQDILDDIFEGSVERVEEFSTHMSDAFQEVSDTIRGGFPAWAEYEQMLSGTVGGFSTTVEAEFAEVIAAQDRFLEDLTAFADSYPTIMEHASADTIAFIDALGPAVQGAFGRMSTAEQIDWINQINANFETQAEQIRRIWTTKIPQSVALGTSMMITSLMGTVEESGLQGEKAAQMFGDLLVQEIAALPEEYQDDVAGYVEDLLGEEGIGASLFGEGITQDWIDGIIRKLKTLAAQVGGTISGETGKIKQQVNKLWGNQSPSKWWQQTGDYWIQGLEKGIKNGLPGISALLTPDMMLSPSMAGVSPSSSITNNKSASQTINLNFSSAARGTLPEVQTALTLLHLVSGVEGGHGRLN